MSTRISTAWPTSAAHADLVAQLRDKALIKGDVTLSSGAKAKYLIDAKRVFLTPAGFRVITELVGDQIRKRNATAVGGLTLGADAIACAAVASGEEVKGFFVRKDAKRHGLQRRIEGPELMSSDRCLIVDDVVTSGASTIQAIEVVRAEGLAICGVVSILDRLRGGGPRIEAAAGAPYFALTTIDDVYPERPDR
jgi:orotate phosphoribosyltransferase